MSIIVRTEDLTRILPGEVPVTLVEGIDLEIQMGEFVAIMGPSGSGKSSLLYLLGLLDMPTGGKIWIDSVDTAGLDEDRLASLRLEKLGFVFQFHFLLAEFSALDNIACRCAGWVGYRRTRSAGRAVALAAHSGSKDIPRSGRARCQAVNASALRSPALLPTIR